MNWEWDYALESFPTLLLGLGSTLFITIVSAAIALVLGFVLAFVRVRRIVVLSPLAKIYIQIIRNTPLLVQVYLFFFALPDFGIMITPVWSAIIVLGMQTGAYMSEIYRGGIENVSQEQWDACTALNLPARRVWLKIVLPQALIPIIPALGNHVNSLLKLTSYASAIGVIELFGQSLRIAEYTYKYLVPLSMAGLLYLVLSISFAVIIRRLEVRNNKRSFAHVA